MWCWDITWLPTTVKGQFFYWYMVKDIHSRKLVANEVHGSESSALAARLLETGCLREGVAGRPLVLHSDNGAAMKGSTMLATLQNLGTAICAVVQRGTSSQWDQARDTRAAASR